VERAGALGREAEGRPPGRSRERDGTRVRKEEHPCWLQGGATATKDQPGDVWGCGGTMSWGKDKGKEQTITCVTSGR
jgi:hypothetical protein